MSSQWVDGLARSMIQHAARRAPASLAERLEEEWLADFEGRSGRLARLRFGMGCCWATRVIAHEYLEPKIAAAGTATTGSKVMTAVAHDNFSLLSFLSRRTTAVAFIIGLHALIIYAFTTGLVSHVFNAGVPPITMMPDPPRHQDPPPPLPPPTFAQQPIQVVEHKIPIDATPIEPAVPAVSAQARETVLPVTSNPEPVAINRVLGGPGKSFPDSDNYYPAAQIRTGRTGVAAVRVCTDEKGRLTAAPMLEQTSGSTGLDLGAVKLASAGSGHYRPTTENGQPVSSCYSIRIRFGIR